jgi:hypothetical protein
MPRQCVRLFDRLQKIVGARDVVSVVGITSTAVVVQPQHFGMQRFAILLTALSAWSVMPDLSPAIFAAVGVSAYLSHFGYSIVPGDSLRVVDVHGTQSYMLFLGLSVARSGDLLLRCARWVCGRRRRATRGSRRVRRAAASLPSFSASPTRLVARENKPRLSSRSCLVWSARTNDLCCCLEHSGARARIVHRRNSVLWIPSREQLRPTRRRREKNERCCWQAHADCRIVSNFRRHESFCFFSCRVSSISRLIPLPVRLPVGIRNLRPVKTAIALATSQSSDQTYV